MRPAASQRGGDGSKRATIFTQTGLGQERQDKAQKRTHVGAWGYGYGLEAAHANAVWRAGAMAGGSTASFTCRRIFRMTLLSVIAAMIRSVPC